MAFRACQFRRARSPGSNHWTAGTCLACSRPPPPHARATPSRTYPLKPTARRTGINRESKLLLLRVAFDTWQLARVSFRTDSRNTSSRAAIAALGAHFEGVLRAASPAYDGGLRDSASYSILAQEWPAVRSRLAARLKTKTWQGAPPLRSAVSRTDQGQPAAGVGRRRRGTPRRPPDPEPRG
ncbi:MAG: GNAT family N-acetyltransferase [Angustibacter sp.]